MLSLEEITSRAKDAPRQTTDVEVVFDAGVTEQLEALRTQRSALQDRRDDIDADLDAALADLGRDSRAGDGRPAAARDRADTARADIDQQLEAIEAQFAAVQADAAQFLVTFRFTALHGFEWTELTARSTPRDGVAEDAGRAYNLDEVTKTAAARSGQRLDDGGTPIEVTPTEWAAVWDTLPAPGLTAIKMAVWYLNEYAWVQARDEAVVAARKASTGRPAATPPSPSDSASTPDASPAGNPSPSPTTSTTTADA